MEDKSGFSEQMPQTIGRYKVQESIGFGAMGAVYKAFDPLIKRTLAIKTIRLDIPRQSPQYKSFIERFYHEARISGTLSHPNIVTLFDIGEEGGIPYLAMEFVEGDTISALIEKGTRFNPEKVIGLVSQIASAVDYAHSKGVIHRDIKPSNLILFEADRVKVTDFGIAKLVDAEMTQSGTLLGTPSYMSPEQAMGDKLDGRSDIFSLGVCAFEMLSGEQPFPGTNVTSILYKLVHVDPIEPADLEMHGLVPQKWHDVFGKVLAKKPDDRYQTATEFVQDLEYCLGSWFGSAMGDDTMVEGVPAISVEDPSSVTRTLPRARPSIPEAPPATPADSATASLARGPAAQPPKAATPPKGAPAASDEPDTPATVLMKAPIPETDGATVLMKATPPLKAPAPETDGATVLMKGTPPLKAPVPETDGATVVMKGGPPPPRPVKKPAVVPEPAVGATVLMPALPPPPPKRPKAPPPPAPPVDSPATVRQPIPEMALPPLPSPPVRVEAPPRPAPPPGVEAPAESHPPPMGRGLASGLILGGILLLVLLMGGVGLALYLRSRPSSSPEPSPQPVTTPKANPTAVPPSPTATPQPPAVEATLHVESEPAGAGVSVNGESKGVTPLDVQLPPGSYDVKVELKGYETKSQPVTLTAENPRVEVKVPLKRPAGPTSGVADVLSTPFGAAVTVDGKPAGQTPLTDLKLPLGNHKVELGKDGFEPWSGAVKVEAGKRGRVDVTLKAVAVAVPSPSPLCADPARIYANTQGEVDTLAKKTSGPLISYPDRVAPRLKAGERVSVSFQFVVTESGEVTELKVAESGGKILDEAILAAVQGWKFSPAVKCGTKVKVRVAQRQTFQGG